MVEKNIEIEYFNWLYYISCGDSNQYNKLCYFLHGVEFIPIIVMDENRAGDGLKLRRDFIIDNHYPESYISYFKSPCSIFEMIVALAIKQEQLMDDPRYGDRTYTWMTEMFRSLGLAGMFDDRFDVEYCEKVIERFLNREYEPDGKGGLFTIKGCTQDLRDVEIWHQMCWYINHMLGY